MDEIALRKEAVRLHLTGETKAAISRKLGKSRDWVRTWIHRYNPGDPEGSLNNHSSAPKHPHRKWSEALIQQAMTSRKLRMEASEPGYKYALMGAQAIHYELKALGITPVPPVRTIHAWLQRAGLIPGEDARRTRDTSQQTVSAATPGASQRSAAARSERAVLLER